MIQRPDYGNRNCLGCSTRFQTKICLIHLNLEGTKMFLAFFKKKEKKKIIAHLRYLMNKVMAEMKRNKCKTISCNFDQISFEHIVWVVNRK